MDLIDATITCSDTLTFRMESPVGDLPRRHSPGLANMEPSAQVSYTPAALPILLLGLSCQRQRQCHPPLPEREGNGFRNESYPFFPLKSATLPFSGNCRATTRPKPEAV